MGRSIEKELVELYVANLELIDEGLPLFVNQHRREAMEAFRLNGLPTIKNEAYRYCNIPSQYKGDREMYFARHTNSDCKFEIDSYIINLSNGFSDKELHIEENGIIFGSFAAATNKYPHIVEKYYNTICDSAKDSLVALNTAFAQDGVFIFVPKGVVAAKPFTVISCLKSSEDLSIYSRGLMIFEDNSKATVVFDNNSSDRNFLANTLCEIFVRTGANLEIVEIQRESDNTTHISHNYASQSNDSTLKTITITLSGGLIRNNLSRFLGGKGAVCQTYGLYLATGEELIDNYTYTEHSTTDCNSFEHYKGVASGNSTAAFFGAINVVRDAQRTQAFMQNNNLLISDNANIHTRPQLEIYADDVKCNHGATIGQLDELSVFYMRQRGLSETEAKRVQMYGFVNEIIEKIGNEDIAATLNKLAENKIAYV